MNEIVAHNVLQAAINCGVKEIVFCSGARNVPFLDILHFETKLTVIHCPEERSAAFFALGRSRLTKCPVAVIVTSGTAAGELLPAAMESYYLQVPLLLITADRPSVFRGSGAPQAAEQVNLYGKYARFFKEIEGEECVDLTLWDKKGVAHLNVCLDEPKKHHFPVHRPLTYLPEETGSMAHIHENTSGALDRFLQHINHPLVIVSALDPASHQDVVSFLSRLQAPLLLEGVSGIREHPDLQDLRIRNIDRIFESALHFGYPIDGVLRIGGVPTARVWRDLEYLQQRIAVHSISDQSFSGLSWNREELPYRVKAALTNYIPRRTFFRFALDQWLKNEREFATQLDQLFAEYPTAEPSLIHELSKIIPDRSHVYLGNSLPIREWDMAAASQDKHLTMTASRGLCGIDGQISTFLGLSRQDSENWAILGDLTMIYDMAGFWVVPQMNVEHLTIAVINNGGGKIFERMFPHKEMVNSHQISFEGLSKMWNFDYLHWTSIPPDHRSSRRQLIEIVPDPQQTAQFWAAFQSIHIVREELISCP